MRNQRLPRHGTFYLNYLLHSKYIVIALLLLLGCATIQKQDSASSITPTELRCEYLQEPLGIDVKQPRLSWKLKAVVRTSLEIRCCSCKISVSLFPCVLATWRAWSSCSEVINPPSTRACPSRSWNVANLLSAKFHPLNPGSHIIEKLQTPV